MECREINDDEGSFSLSHPHLETMQIVHATHWGKSSDICQKMDFNANLPKHQFVPISMTYLH